MKVKIEAVIDLGDDFIDENCPDEVRWARKCVEDSIQIRVSDGTGCTLDDYPLEITYCESFYE